MHTVIVRYNRGMTWGPSANAIAAAGCHATEVVFP